MTIPSAKRKKQKIADAFRTQVKRDLVEKQRRQIVADLRKYGADAFDLRLPETHALPLFLRDSEHVTGVVYGHYSQSAGDISGRGILFATNERVVLVDKKPAFVRCDELSYSAVQAVTYTQAGFAEVVILHTRMGTITIHTFNKNCAEGFVKAIESGLFAEIKN